MSLLDKCTNMFGSLGDDIKERINIYLATPSVEGWEDIHSIIISNKLGMHTIWQAVIAIDDSFPKTGRRTDSKNIVLREWEKIPHPFLLRRAIKNAIK